MLREHLENIPVRWVTETTQIIIFFYQQKLTLLYSVALTDLS